MVKLPVSLLSMKEGRQEGREGRENRRLVTDELVSQVVGKDDEEPVESVFKAIGNLPRHSRGF
jgi:hypothetical protein